MNDLIKELGAFFRQLGFKGSGQTFRKTEDDYIFVINIQGSRGGDVFFVNLGAQPKFVPAECNAALTTLKEYECIMRMRVGTEWSWALSGRTQVALMREIETTQATFFGRVRTLRAAIPRDSVDELIQKFSEGTTHARAALHLARAAAALGHSETARALVDHGLSIAGERATALIYDLKAVREVIT